ncbi:MAG: P-II family nitrogen regulator [Spirochaetaceae bacterium]|jgi:nitrogen regulatory protein PII 1|nr:P-II family nitrogen regulator [Spirochaetaceae bacterium]
MKMIKAIIRPEKVTEVLGALSEAGFNAATRMNVLGRGKQQGLKVGDVYYSEIPKEMLLIVIPDKDEEQVTRIIAANARTGKKGSFGDGKIFVLDVEKTITISSGNEEL